MPPDAIPEVLLYVCPDAPPPLMIQGRFLSASGGLQPICFTGADASAVRAEMERWWAEQRSQHLAALERAEKARQAAKDRAARKAKQPETHHDQ